MSIAKLKAHLALVPFVLAIGQPVQATTIFDSNVYATNSAYISGGSYGRVVAGSFTNANGARGTNFSGLTASSAAATAMARSTSHYYAGLASTGIYETGLYTAGDATLTGSTAGINVFNIDGAKYGNLYALKFAGPGTGAIVNISGSSFSNWVGINFGNLSPDQVVFNFYDASNVSMGGMNFAGSILAPNARVQIQGGSVAGSVVSDSFHSEGALIGGNGFAGFAPPVVTPPPVTIAPAGAVPEPGTWAMMLGGFGLAGIALRRRGKSTAALA